MVVVADAAFCRVLPVFPVFQPALVGAGDRRDRRGDRAAFEKLGECSALFPHERRLRSLAEGCRGTPAAARLPFLHEPFAEASDVADGFADEGMAREPFAHVGVIVFQSPVIVGERGTMALLGAGRFADVIPERLGVGEGSRDGRGIGEEAAKGGESVDEEGGERGEDLLNALESEYRNQP